MDFKFPTGENILKNKGVSLSLGLGLKNGKPFKTSEVIGKNGNPNLKAIKDQLGQPRLTSLGLKYGSTEMIIDECILTVTQETNIVSTALQGRNGTIKEFISLGDFSINAELGLSSYQNDEASFEYPKQQLEKLVELFNIHKTLIVDSEFLTVFGIKAAVVTSYEVQQETHSNRQSLRLHMLSDEPYEIRIKRK